MSDNVNHPTHYTAHESGIEVIELSEKMNFCTGNAFKYVARAGKKWDETEDLEKALWYLNREKSRNVILPDRPEVFELSIKYLAAETNDYVFDIIAPIFAYAFKKSEYPHDVLKDAIEQLEEYIKFVRGEKDGGN